VTGPRNPFGDRFEGTDIVLDTQGKGEDESKDDLPSAFACTALGIYGRLCGGRDCLASDLCRCVETDENSCKKSSMREF